MTEKTTNLNPEDELPLEAPASPSEELPDAWWYKIYLLVIITTVIVIGAMVWFTKHFSN